MINVSKNKCVGCGICATDCPVEAISVKDAVAAIDQDKCISCRLCLENCPLNAIREITEEFLIAIGTDDSKKIKSGGHFGMSEYFQVWKYSNGELNFIEKRGNVKYKEDESKIHGDPGKAKATASALKNIDVIIGKIFGPNIARLKNQFVCAVARCETIEQAIQMIKENINEIIEERAKKEKSALILK